MSNVKWLKFIFIFVIGSPLIALLLWYIIAFLPYLSELKLISSRGNESISSIENRFYPIVVAGETTRGIRSFATSKAYWSLIWKQNSKRTQSIWLINTTLWFGASYLHFNEHEIFGLWVECAIQSCKGELQTVAKTQFGKELIELSDYQLARLVTYALGPSIFAFGTELGEKQAKKIWEKANANKP